jgi:hypothetical protein
MYGLERLFDFAETCEVGAAEDKHQQVPSICGDEFRPIAMRIPPV